MKLLRFITEEEAGKLRELSTKAELQNDNKSNYYHAERIDDNEDVEYVKTLLREVVGGFSSFTNFVVKNIEEIRIQYDYDFDKDGPGIKTHFIGVGYVTITELSEGFVVEEK